MADTYLDHGAYPTYAATPTWGVAQDGDGLAIGLATPATVSVNMSTWTFTSGSSAFSVMGCTALTIGAGANSASNAQYSATYATMLANIVAAINLATANTVNVPAGWTVNQVRNTTFARANGNNLEVMTRSGSASWNALVALAFVSVTGASSQAWSGGAGGAWGYLINSTGVVWASAYANMTYGVFNNTVIAGVLAAGDTCYIRTKRAGSNVSAGAVGGSGFTINIPSGTPSNPIIFIADAGLKWAGDSGVFTLASTSGSNDQNFVSAGASGGDGSRTTLFLGTLLTASTSNFVFKLDAQFATLYIRVGANSQFRNVEFVGGQAQVGTFHAGQSFTNLNYADAYGPLLFKDCIARQQHASGVALFQLKAFSNGQVLFEGMQYIAENQVVASTAALLSYNGGSGTYAGQTDWTFRNCSLVGWVLGTTLGRVHFTGQSSAGTALSVIIKIENLSPGNASVTNFGLVGALPVVNSNATLDARLTEDGGSRVLLTSVLTGRQFCYETVRYKTEWNPNSSWPLLRAELPETYNGAENRWVYKLFTGASTTYVNKTNPLSTLRFTKFNTLADGVRTATLEFLVDQSIDTVPSPIKNSEVVIAVMYVGTDGKSRCERSFTYGSTVEASATTSALTWTAMQYDINSVAHYYNKKSVSLTTSAAIKSNTEVFITLMIGKSSPTQDDWFFIDPDVLLA